MKSICSLLSAAALLLLFGCNENGNGSDLPGIIAPHVIIEYFDKKSDEGYKLIMASDKSDDIKAYYENTFPVELVSLTDENGLEFEPAVSVEGEPPIAGHGNIIFLTPEVLPYYKPKERCYTLKYKAPSFRGESVEEVKLVFSFLKYTEVWYNGKEVPLITYKMVHPHYGDPQHVFNKEEALREIKEHLYHGNIVAVSTDPTIHIIIPIEKP